MMTNGNGFDAASINVADHGSAVLLFRGDSTYEIHAEVLKDITLDRTILGKSVRETLVRAVFNTFRTSKFVTQDSTFDLLAFGKSIFVHASYKLWDDEMNIEFEDVDHRHWFST